MNKKTKIVIGVMAIVVIAVALGVSYAGHTKVKQEAVRQEIKIADPGAIGWAPFYVALDKGLFDQAGLNVTDIPVQTGDEAIKAVMSKDADVAFAGILPYSFAAFNYPELKIFAQTGAAHDAQIIFSNDKNIKAPADLKGKKIGYAKNTASDMEVHKFLQNNNLTEKDIQLVPMKPLAMITALTSGQIDAYSAWEPNIMNARKILGDKFGIFDSEANTYTWHPAIIANTNYISQNKTTLIKLTSVWKEAQDYIKDNPDESIAIVAKHAKVSPEDLKTAWAKYDFFVSANNTTTNILATDLAWANAQSEKPADTVPAPDSLIDKSILNEINK